MDWELPFLLYARVSRLHLELSMSIKSMMGRHLHRKNVEDLNVNGNKCPSILQVLNQSQRLQRKKAHRYLWSHSIDPSLTLFLFYLFATTLSHKIEGDEQLKSIHLQTFNMIVGLKIDLLRPFMVFRHLWYSSQWASQQFHHSIRHSPH